MIRGGQPSFKDVAIDVTDKISVSEKFKPHLCKNHAIFIEETPWTLKRCPLLIRSRNNPIEINRCFQFWKWNTFSLISPYFSQVFFTNSENATKSKFRQETLNILRALKFAGSHLAFYEWKVSFRLISPIIFSLGKSLILSIKSNDNFKPSKTFIKPKYFN